MLQSVDISLRGNPQIHLYCMIVLFLRCIRGLLSDKIIILVTHQVQYLEQCHATLGLQEVLRLL